MRNQIVLLLLITSINCFGQFSLKGRIIDYKNKQPVNYASIIISNNKQEAKSKQIFTNSSGQFNCDSLSVGTYKIEINYIGYVHVVIKNIVLFGNVDLCDMFVYTSSFHSDGLHTTTVYPGYLEKNSKYKRIKLKYFCNKMIKGKYYNNFLNIDYKRKQKNVL
ncbi:MAG: carboxypeptidase regulatory-like domain-containing protein [Bacteroidetes bacterium]|nr:carboxypeptidase regulatory-like domain-containing protein [Bacteroidota bacterium]